MIVRSPGPYKLKSQRDLVLALLLLGLAVLAVGLADCLAGVLHVTGHLYSRGTDFFWRRDL